jgi:MGT family glycosyltransferase
VKALAYTSPARGNLYPLVPIVLELAARRHRPTVYTLAAELAHLAQVGIRALPIDPTVEGNEVEDWRERSPIGGVRSTLRTLAERAVSEGPDLARAIDCSDPDVLLIDINCWGAATVAEASGRPWAVYSPYLPPLPSRDAPPYGPGLTPLRGPLGAMRDLLVRSIVDRALGRAAEKELNALRARHGLPGVDGFLTLLERAPLVLALTAEGFEYPRSDWPTNVRLVGPLDWAPPEQAPSWLEQMSEPLVLVTCSTERQDDERLVRVALQALPAAGFSVLATTAAHDPAAFHAPAGSRVVRFIAHEAILERAACVVCHGGLGITQKALAAGVPVVVVPFGRDQFETARRVELAEAGIRLTRHRLSAARLAQAVRVAIARRAGAQRVSRAFAAAGGQSAAADAIEAIARSRP